jgi:molecular chaperone DnaJ
VKKAFFKLAKKYHPDVNKAANAQAKYVEINEAYETLGNEGKRRIYDSTGMSSNE